MNIREARTAYLALRDRCLIEHPEHRSYVLAMHETWDQELAALGDERDLRPYIDHLTRATVNADSTAALDWLDAYPDAIVSRERDGMFA